MTDRLAPALWGGAAVAVAAAAVILPCVGPVYAGQGTSLQDPPSGALFVGTAGDLPQTENLIYVVHKRPLDPRERTILRGMDSKFPDERITLTVYRMNANGAKGANGTPCALVFQRDITLDTKMLGSTQAIVDEIEQNKTWLNEAVGKVESKKPKSP